MKYFGAKTHCACCFCSCSSPPPPPPPLGPACDCNCCFLAERIAANSSSAMLLWCAVVTDVRRSRAIVGCAGLALKTRARAWPASGERQPTSCLPLSLAQRASPTRATKGKGGVGNPRSPQAASRSSSTAYRHPKQQRAASPRSPTQSLHSAMACEHHTAAHVSSS